MDISLSCGPKFGETEIFSYFTIISKLAPTANSLLLAVM